MHKMECLHCFCDGPIAFLQHIQGAPKTMFSPEFFSFYAYYVVDDKAQGLEAVDYKKNPKFTRMACCKFWNKSNRLTIMLDADDLYNRYFHSVIPLHSYPGSHMSL